MDDLATRWQQAQLEYRGKIRTAAYNSAYVSKEHDVEDMEQELLIILWQACQKYDPDKGMSFNSFFWMMAKQKISMIGDYSKAVKRTAVLVSLDAAAMQEEMSGLDDEIQTANAQPSAEDEVLYRLRAQEVAKRSGLARQWRQVVERYAAG